jgi:hypothetical protein
MVCIIIVSFNAMSLPYLFLCLCVLGLACAAIALFAFSVLAWAKKWKVLKWLSTAATFITGAACLLLNYALTTEGDRPFLREPPIMGDIPGVYALEADSAADLAAKGYTNLSAQVSVKGDGTFEIRQMPHLWLYGSTYRAGYDTCHGKWKIKKTSGGGRYYLAAWFDAFDVGSAYTTDTQKGSRWVSLDLIAKTKKRPDYSLAVPLNCGDEGYIFLRKLNANHAMHSNSARTPRFHAEDHGRGVGDGDRSAKERGSTESRLPCGFGLGLAT